MEIMLFLNGIKIVPNTSTNIVNGGISLINSIIYVGHDVIFNAPSVPSQFKDAGISLFHSSTKTTSESYNYSVKTPINQQIKDVGETLKNVQTYENALTLGISLYNINAQNLGFSSLKLSSSSAKNIATEGITGFVYISQGELQAIKTDNF